MRPELRAAIVQDAASGRVLMLAWMDDEALRRTRESGLATFWSRSRQEYWQKGETSGNTLAVAEIRDDCDGDAILLRVRPAGPVCHTGAESCFSPWLWRRIVERRSERPEGSYVVSLLDQGSAAAARKAAEAALVASEERWRAIVDHTPNVAIQRYDATGRILAWNRASESVYGIAERDAVGTRVWFSLEPEPATD